MRVQCVQPQRLGEYRQWLREREKSEATVAKYSQCVGQFLAQYAGQVLDKALVLEYKEGLGRRYAAVTANAALAAVNGFLRFCGRGDCVVKPFRVQKKVYCSEERELSREEYLRLVTTARCRGDRRLELLLESICSTGVRVSEVAYITVEAVEQGEAVVTCKGKTRTVFLTKALKRKLRSYIQERGITSGPIFVTRTGKPMNRSNIWREMKSLCREAGVASSKVFPHSLRHLFARVFYQVANDIAKLADVLGHANINTTRIYIMTTGEEHRRQMEQLDLIT